MVDSTSFPAKLALRAEDGWGWVMDAVVNEQDVANDWNDAGATEHFPSGVLPPQPQPLASPSFDKSLHWANGTSIRSDASPNINFLVRIQTEEDINFFREGLSCGSRITWSRWKLGSLRSILRVDVLKETM